MKDGVDSADDNEYGHDGIEQPVFDNSLESKVLIDSFSEGDPNRYVLIGWRVHG